MRKLACSKCVDAKILIVGKNFKNLPKKQQQQLTDALIQFCVQRLKLQKKVKLGLKK